MLEETFQVNVILTMFLFGRERLEGTTLLTFCIYLERTICKLISVATMLLDSNGYESDGYYYNFVGKGFFSAG